MKRPAKKSSGDSKPYHILGLGSRFCPTPQSLVAAVQELVAARPDVRIWLLEGQLGAGKTTIVRGILRAHSVSRTVASPTYTLRQEYALKKSRYQRLIHIDAYRIRSAGEVAGIGLLDDLEDPDCLIWIEWPDRIADVMLPPAAHLRLSLEKTGRRLTWTLPTVAQQEG